jgi:hypothetical protein
MKLTRNFVLPLAALFFGLLLIPRSALAGTADCPSEPKQNVPIASGDLFAGTNCTLNTPGDVDSFVFSANSGDVYSFFAGINTGSQNMCLTLYNPSAAQIFSGCTNLADDNETFTVVTDQTLTTTGSYTMVITELTEGAVNYGASLERLYPVPPDAQKLSLGTVVAGSVTSPADEPAYTFAGVTTGTYQLSATAASGSPQNLCMTVYSPSGSSAGSGCTNIFFGSLYTVQIDFTPPVAGSYMVLVYEDPGGFMRGSETPINYTLEASCLVGVCTQTYPPCTLKNAASYASGTLTMDFTVGNNVATTWNAWLTDQNTITNLFSLSQPITVPPVTITKTTTLSPEGTVGVLSTLTTPTKGIFCSSYVQINTGKP